MKHAVFETLEQCNEWIATIDFAKGYPSKCRCTTSYTICEEINGKFYARICGEGLPLSLTSGVKIEEITEQLDQE